MNLLTLWHFEDKRLNKILTKTFFSTATPKREEEPGTVYKTVDFIKTEAFNRTRQKVEEYKYNIKPESK